MCNDTRESAVRSDDNAVSARRATVINIAVAHDGKLVIRTGHSVE